VWERDRDYFLLWLRCLARKMGRLTPPILSTSFAENFGRLGELADLLFISASTVGNATFL
jgi:hypothetical protein